MTKDVEPREAKMVKLANGAQEPDILVNVTMFALGELIGRDPIAFYEFTMKCRDGSHVLWGDAEERLKKVGLIEKNGEIHDVTRNTVLSAVKGEDLEMTLGSPFPETKQELPQA